MDESFSGKSFLVTGAGRGIGREIAVKLAKSGARVYALSKTKINLESLSKENPNIETICVDLADWKATEESLADLPIVHGLVNNAAISITGSFLDVKPDDFDKIFNTNVKSVINVSQIVVRNMLRNNVRGSIVNISSQASMGGKSTEDANRWVKSWRTVWKSLVALNESSLYCGTKGALDAISKVMALELGPRGIRVNCVNPTVVMTDMGRKAWSDPQKSRQMLDRIPLGRFAEIDDVVDAVFFLLGRKSSMCTGVMLPVDGGFLAC